MELAALKTVAPADKPKRPVNGWPLFVLLLVLSISTWPLGFSNAQTAISRRFTASLTLQEIAPGIEYGQVSTGTASSDELTGPWLINVLRLNLRQVQLQIVHALDEGVGLETVSSMAARHGATAAINGGYFRTTGTYRGESIGVLLLKRKLLSETHNERAAFGLIQHANNTDVVLGHLRFTGAISTRGTKHEVHGLNRPVSPDELILFTPEFHRTTLTSPDGIEVVVRRNRVISVTERIGSSEIPSDGYVISAQGKSREWVKRNVQKGFRLSFTWKLTSLEAKDDERWNRAYSLLGGGPQLIKGGKIAITDIQEKMAPGFATDRHPRTSIATLSSGKLLLLTVDGRQPGVSVGMSLKMLAELLLEFGAVDAINLDGGGSTTMVLNGKVVNRPSDQTGERPVSDAILVFPKQN